MCKKECNGHCDCNCDSQTKPFEQTIKGIEAWGVEKGIYAESNVSFQLKKFLQETVEVTEAVEKLVCFKSLNVSDKTDEAMLLKDVELEFGDVIVTLVGQCKFLGLDLATCAELALQKISKRKGKMIDGFFVKEESSENSLLMPEVLEVENNKLQSENKELKKDVLKYGKNRELTEELLQQILYLSNTEHCQDSDDMQNALEQIHDLIEEF
jgi:NTP pyrophosphatase (non-canonical NTP hydrolase)